jgi:predicted CoA-binding protein
MGKIIDSCNRGVEVNEIRSIAIIGAVNNRKRYSNKAVRAYRSRGYVVYPISVRNEEIEGLRAYRSILDVPGDVDAVSLYVNPDLGIKLLDDIAKKGVETLFVNPGAESDELIEKAESLGMKPLLVCSILSIGIDPETM